MKNLLATVVLTLLAARCGQEGFESARERMVRDQIVARGISDTATIRAMRSVPRHRFVPPVLTGDAYGDFPLPIGQGQTISQPYIVALMTELIAPRKGHHVLEIGTGSGYQAAVLAEIVDSVYTVELLPELAASAAGRLGSLNYRNIVVRQGDGYLGWKERAPFDAILVTAAAEDIPGPLVEQIKDGGVMVIPVGRAEAVQALTVVTKKTKDIVTKVVLPVRFVPLVRPH